MTGERVAVLGEPEGTVDFFGASGLLAMYGEGECLGDTG